MSKIWLVASIIIFSLSVLAQENQPTLTREFRGMWVATYTNLDFPSNPNLSAKDQRDEVIKLLDLADELKMNAIIFQVRSMCDAFYESDIEPSSYYLTGKMGEKLKFDPLKFLIEQAHLRGILVHAWFNPYRASSTRFNKEVSSNHVLKRHPDWIREYSIYKIIDPGIKEVQDYIISVIADVVMRYDIDGVHFDDYFYPYPDLAKTDFPDTETYALYRKSGGKLNKGDWRRKNVDDLMYNVSVKIKKIKPQVMFGVSPFGIWKQDATQGIICSACSYDVIYSDTRKWLHEGWIDYITPQLYWSTSKKGQEFEKLLHWWNIENKNKKHLWVGIAPYKVGNDRYPDFASPKEIETQIKLTRSYLGDGAGTIHFRALSYFQNENNLKDSIRSNVYNINAVIPETPWIKASKLSLPKLKLKKNNDKTLWLPSWSNSMGEEAFRWAFYWKVGEEWNSEIFPSEVKNAEFSTNIGIKMFAVAGIDRLGNISQLEFKVAK